MVVFVLALCLSSYDIIALVKRWTIIFLASVSALALIFISGQIFYYKKRVDSIIGSRVSFDSSLTANLSNLSQNKLTLKSEIKELVVEPAELQKWIENYTRAYNSKQELRFNINRIKSYLEKNAKDINIAPVNARLKINEGKIIEFKAPEVGQKLNIQATITNITSALARDSRNGSSRIAELVVDKIESAISLDRVNDLGINELLARGESDFGGSPKFRTQNINVGSQKFDGIMLAPGENFSFNQFLGEVNALTGFVPELVIKNGKLIPEYGGGICQVSTTLFRAVVVAGLPILERHAHSLPVRYYNPQGYDATIYPGVSDLRFRNDMPAYILIQSKIVGSKLYFEIYGTKDSRQVTIDGPRQYDIQHSGALKAELIRTVTYSNGQEKKDVFKSSYKSPSLFPTIRNPLE